MLIKAWITIQLQLQQKSFQEAGNTNEYGQKVFEIINCYVKCTSSNVGYEIYLINLKNFTLRNKYSILIFNFKPFCSLLDMEIPPIN